MFHYSDDELITYIQDRHVSQTLSAMVGVRRKREEVRERSKRPSLTAEEFFSLRQ